MITLNQLEVYKHHINCVFKCGMLVDEHVELLHQYLTSPKLKSNGAHWKIASVSLICGCIYSGLLESVFPVVLSSLPLSAIFAKDLIRYFKYKGCIKRFENLTKTFRKISDFNKGVQKYYERRLAALSKLDDATKIVIETPIKIKLSEFVKNIFAEMDVLVNHMHEQLLNIKEFIPDQLWNVCNLNLYGKIHWDVQEDASSQFKTLQMCYILATSTYLLGISVALSTQPEHVLSKILPISEKFIISKYKDMKNSLEEATYELPPPQLRHNESFVRTDSLITVSKLLESLQLTYHACIGTQQSIFTLTNDDIIRNQLNDLEKLFLECSSLLSILQHEYNYNKKPIKTKSKEIPEEVISKEQKTIKTFRYDDIDDLAEDEQYEISIHSSDLESDPEDDPTNVEYEQLKEQIRAQKMILKELNDELLKRKLVKEEFIDQNLKSKPKIKTIDDVDLNDLAPPANWSCNVDFLAQIQAMAHNRGGEESVFGDED
ncbi:uncharacterized protein [Onthophagus taurus]|uniref:uncharacterized protein isoform X1 n=1 Tax=Onthophagus taurus TaxID=166361 RepID=UPI0039BE2B1D